MRCFCTAKVSNILSAETSNDFVYNATVMILYTMQLKMLNLINPIALRKAKIVCNLGFLRAIRLINNIASFELGHGIT